MNITIPTWTRPVAMDTDAMHMKLFLQIVGSLMMKTLRLMKCVASVEEEDLVIMKTCRRFQQ